MLKEKGIVDLQMDHYLGGLVAFEREGKYFLSMESNNPKTPIEREISQQFYEAIKKEFKVAK